MVRTPEQRAIAVQMTAESATQEEIAEKLGVSQQTVSRLIQEGEPNMAPRITKKQETAYRLIFIEDLNVEQAAALMKTTPKCVRRLLDRVFTKYPSLRASLTKPKEILVGDFNAINPSHIKQVF